MNVSGILYHKCKCVKNPLESIPKTPLFSSVFEDYQYECGVFEQSLILGQLTIRRMEKATGDCLIIIGREGSIKKSSGIAPKHASLEPCFWTVCYFLDLSPPFVD